MSRKTSKLSKRTSTEAAATALKHVAFIGTSEEVLEAQGELSSPYSLPPPEPQPKDAKRTRRIPKNPIAAAASDSALSAKWGMAEYERLAETGGSRRVTRTYAHAARSSVSKTRDGELTKGQTVSMNTETLNNAPTAPSNELPGHEARSRPEGLSKQEELRPEEGCASREESRHSGSTHQSAQSRQDGSTARAWTQVPDGKSTTLLTRPALVIADTRFSSWFDLCDVEDQLGSLPEQWDVRPRVYTLPVVNTSNASFTEEFWQEVDSSASDTE
ncbi:hypothetical protein PYCCODRAFT_1415569, partial [Trametes coccinea BRFM310]